MALLAFCFLLFIVGVGRWDLWNPDEPRYAQVAREMVTRGDWILMHANGIPYEDKPPLFFWLIALSSYLWQGFTSFSARFPSGLFGVLTVFLTFFLGKRLYGPRGGFLSALILATSFEFAYLSTRANIDATLTFFTTASLFLFLRWYQHRKTGNEKRDQGKLPIYGFYVSMGLATLAKGPVGFILPLLVGLVYLLLRKDWRAIRDMRLLTGTALLMAIVLSWYFPAVLKGGQDYLNETLIHQTFDRFAKGSSHIRPVYYYFINFPVDFLPWFLFFPGAFVYCLSKKKQGIPKEILFLLVWFVAIFLFFSLSKGKRGIYLLPLYPAASLLVGRYWDDYLSDDGRQSAREVWFSIPIYLSIIVLFLMGMFLFVAPAIAHFPAAASMPRILKMIVKGAGLGAQYLSYVPQWSITPFILLLVGSSILLFLAHHRKHKSIVFILAVATVGIGFFYGTRVIFPLVNPYKSARFISEEVRKTLKPGDRLVMYGDFGSVGTAPYNFYTGIVPILEIESEKEIVDLFRSKEKLFCLVEYDDYEKLTRKYTDLPFHLIRRRGVGSRDMVFLSNR